jgi:chloramphenicol 3-O-phosphotransferase
VGESVAGDRRELLERLLSAAADDSLEAMAVGAERATAFARMLAPIAACSELEVTWIGVNRHRVDATVESADGHVWRVVFGTPDGKRIEWLSVFKRQAYEPAAGGIAIVLNGPSGAGKSLLMEALAAVSPLPWVRFDEPTYGTVDAEYLIWRETADALHLGFVHGMAALAATGNRVIASAAGLPQSWFRDAFGFVPALYVGLDCPLAELLTREDGRDGRWGCLAESSVTVHDGWDYDLRLDSATFPPEVLAVRVLRELADRRIMC